VIYACAVRTCSRIGCTTFAAATAAMRYEERSTLLMDLVADPDPGLVDLCLDHAARLTPPMGWTIADLRIASAVPARAVGLSSRA
jgi:hypothetical protein